MAYDQSVRTLMNNNKYDNDKIGYNADSGYVTYGGQNFMKPQLNVNGTTYTDQATFDQAHNQYKQNSANAAAAYNTTPQPAAQPANQGYTNPYTQQITDILAHLNAATQAPPVDVYSSPQYAAAQAQAQRGVAEGQRQSRENLNRRGILDSSLTSSQANQIAANSNEYLTTQLVPQIQAQLQAQRQQELQAQQNMFQNYFNLSNQADSQHNADRNFDAGRQDAATAATGYWAPDANTLSSVRKQMEANSAAYASASPDRQKQLHEDNLRLATSIGGSDTTGNGDYAFGPMRTVQGQQLDTSKEQFDKQFNAQEAQRQWDNTFKQGQFDYQKASDLWEQNFKDKSFDQSVKQFAQNLGADYAKLNQSQQQFVAEMAYKNKALEMQNDPNNLDNQYKKAQIESLTNKNDKSADHGIDEYDLAMIDSLASQKGLDVGKADASAIKQFVAGLKAQNAWSTDEAKQVESYLGQKAAAAQAANKTANDQRAERVKKADDIAKRLGSGRIGG
ncbi:hypothetical protein A8709_33055 [Paenibacillus pectinilyticus]|uniref:Uncharacterized protein n=1 Tax=Paenibacillus pectinilyticus TaxID=512399 RepID=A0A1C0ZX07_9BACL|nr:hypothetical protein [Paenibacillus pectinilyticus]OCT12641.1 hypothetical protein A8709_33055 [Paenibacillus pectinilyticus]